MGGGQREWVVYLIGEKRLPAELQRGGGGHEQACLLSHQEATIRREKLGQLPCVHMYDKELTELDPLTEPDHVVFFGHPSRWNQAPELVSLAWYDSTKKSLILSGHRSQHRAEFQAGTHTKKRVLITMQLGC